MATRTALAEKCGSGTALRWWSAGANAGPSSPMSASPNSTSTRGSTTAVWKHGALHWSRNARSARPPSASRFGVSKAQGSRPPTAPRCTARSPGTMARESLPIPPLHRTRSPSSNRPSRSATWLSSRTGTATGSTNSTRSWARYEMRPTWSNSARMGATRIASREMIDTEQRLHRAAELMAERERHWVPDADRKAALARSETRGLVLSGEQADALAHVTEGRDLAVMVGHAGTGKSAMLGVAREVWESAGYAVRGIALSGIAAENLESGSGIASRTIASLEHGWGQGRDLLRSHDVLVIDEAGMIGTRQLERVLSHAAHAGAKVVLVGDPQQLQSIEAGAAFRSIHERHGGAEIDEVRRQSEDWQ